MFKMAAGRDSMRDSRSIRDVVPPDLLRTAVVDLRGTRGKSVVSVHLDFLFLLIKDGRWTKLHARFTEYS